MNTKRVFCVLLAAVLLSAGCGVCSAGSFSSTILIKIDLNTSSITDIVDGADIIYDYSPLMPGYYALRTPSGYTQDEAIAYYSSLPGIIYAEPDGEVSLADTASPAQTTSPQSPYPIAGLLAGLGIATGVLVKARKF